MLEAGVMKAIGAWSRGRGALLPSGKVLAGGGNGGATEEPYNPTTNAWKSARMRGEMRFFQVLGNR